MGLFTFYLGYRHGKKKAARRLAREEWAAQDWSNDDPECDDCGYRASQHDDEGACPSYS